MPISIHGLAPLLQVFDMPVSLHFYRDILGFKVMESSEPVDDCDWVLLRTVTAELMLNTAYERDQRPPAPNPDRAAAHEDTCLYIGCADVDEAYNQLRASGLNVEPPTTAPYGMRQLYLKDPDGYGVCFQWPASPNP